MMAGNLCIVLKYKYHNVKQLNLNVNLTKCQYLRRTINTILYTYFWPTLYIYIYIYRVSQEECARLREGVPYVKLY